MRAQEWPRTVQVQSVNQTRCQKARVCACARWNPAQRVLTAMNKERGKGAQKAARAHARARFHQRNGARRKPNKVPKKQHVRTCARVFGTARRNREKRKSDEKAACAHARARPRQATAKTGTKIRDYQWHGRRAGSTPAAVKKRPAATRHRAPHKIRDYQWHGLSRRQKCAQNTNVTHGC